MPDGSPYAVQRYKQIVEERYQISKYCNTSYSDTGNITPTERRYLLSFINEDLEAKNRIVEENLNKSK